MVKWMRLHCSERRARRGADLVSLRRDSMGLFGEGPGEYHGIGSIALLPDSEGVAVVDKNGYKVCVYGLDGGLLREFGTQGEGDGQFQYPFGVAVSTRGEVFVSDVTQNRIQVFTKEGVFLRAFGSKGSGDGQFVGPTNMCFNHEEHLVICDVRNYRVQVVREDGVFVRAFGMEKSQEGSNLFPQFVCCDRHDGSIVVCGREEEIDTSGVDSDDKTEVSSVQLFSATGRYVRTIGSVRVMVLVSTSELVGLVSLHMDTFLWLTKTKERLWCLTLQESMCSLWVGLPPLSVSRLTRTGSTCTWQRV